MEEFTNPVDRRIMIKRLKSVSFIYRRIAASSLRNDVSAMTSSNSRVSKFRPESQATRSSRRPRLNSEVKAPLCFGYPYPYSRQHGRRLPAPAERHSPRTGEVGPWAGAAGGAPEGDASRRPHSGRARAQVHPVSDWTARLPRLGTQLALDAPCFRCQIVPA